MSAHPVLVKIFSINTKNFIITQTLIFTEILLEQNQNDNVVSINHVLPKKKKD